jgi:hypothetical protein
MAKRRHTVGNYDYSIDAGLGEPGRLRLWAPDGRQLAEIGFVSPDTAVPAPRLAPDLSSAAAFLKSSVLGALLDMLRNEKPVFLTLDDTPPGYVHVHTRKTRAPRSSGTPCDESGIE